MNKYKPSDMPWYEKFMFHIAYPIMIAAIAILGLCCIPHIIWQKLRGEE